jgi:hypothetical protein
MAATTLAPLIEVIHLFEISWLDLCDILKVEQYAA